MTCDIPMKSYLWKPAPHEMLTLLCEFKSIVKIRTTGGIIQWATLQ